MPILKCECCNREYKDRTAFTRHISVCKFIQISAKEKTLITEYIEKNPSIEDVYKLVVNLCVENTKLKERIERLEHNNFINKKRTIEDYLSMIPKDNISYSNWLNHLIVTDENLQVLFSSNLIECIKSVLEASFLLTHIEKAPLRAFSQKQHTIYIFEEDKWEPISSVEMTHLVSIISHRILKKYLEWKKLNQEAIDSNEKLQELNIQYMQKANGSGKSTEQRVSEIKKWIFTKIQKSLKSIEES